MSQNIFNDIDPAVTSGSELATLLNEFKDTMVSGLSGTTSRPANLQDYGYWIRTDYPSAGLLTWYLYDGTVDIEIFQINTTTASIILTSSEDSFNIVKNSNDSVGPDLGLKKGRIAGGGQTKLSDILGNVKWSGRDASAVEYVQAKIVSTALEDVVAGAHGANLAFYVTQEGSSSLVKAVTISDEKKLGIGVDDPTQMVETFATDSTAGFKATIAEDSTVGASMTLQKKRVTGNGQVLTGDTVGNFKLNSTDNSGNEIASANIKAVASATHTGSEGGTSIIIERVKVGATSLSTAITIDEDSVNIVDDLEVGGDADVTGSLTVNNGLSVPTGNVGFTNDLTVGGDLTVNGTTTTIDTDNLTVEDKNITINSGGSDATSEGAGLTVERTATDGSLTYEDALASKFKAGALGSESEIITAGTVQNITGVKTMTTPVLNSPAVSTPSKLDVKQDTRANLETYVLTATDGQVCFATDEGKYYGVNDNKLVAIGGGVGSTETIKIINGDDGVGDWDLTGLTNATLVQNTTTPLNGDSDFKYTNVSGSTNEIAWSEDIDIPLKSQSNNNLLGVSLALSTSSGYVDNDMKVHLYDNTNSVYMDSVFVKAGAGQRYELLNYADDTVSIKYGIEIIQVNNGEYVNFDDLEFKRVVYPMVETATIENYTAVYQANFFDTTGACTTFDTSLIPLAGSDLIEWDDTTQTRLVAKKKCSIVMMAQVRLSNNTQGFIKNSSGETLCEAYSYGNANNLVSATVELETGDYIYIELTGGNGRNGGINIQAQASTQNVVVSGDTEDDIYLRETVEKILSADVTAVGDISELQFDNLIIGKEYELNGIIRYAKISTPRSIYWFDTAGGLGTVYGKIYGDDAVSGADQTSDHISFKFIATSTTLYTYSTTNPYGNGTKEETFLQLRRVDWSPKMFALPVGIKDTLGATIDGTAGSSVSIIKQSNGANFTVTQNSTGKFRVNYSSQNLVNIPAIQATILGGVDNTIAEVYGTPTNEYCDIKTMTDSGGFSNLDFSFTLTKLGVDENEERVYVGKVDPIRTMFIDVDATEYFDQVTGTTSYKTRPLLSLSGDIFGSISSDELDIPNGTYIFYIPVGSFNSGGVDLEIYDNGNTTQLKEYITVAYQSAATGWSWNTVVEKFTFSEAMTLEFNTKADAGGNEGISRIMIQKLS